MLEIPGQPTHQKYKITKATIGLVYLYAETTALSPASLFEVRYPEKLDKLSAQNSLAIQYTKVSKDRLAPDTSSEDVSVQIEGSNNKIILIKFGEEEPIYQDEINCIYLVKLPLPDLKEQKQISSLKKAAVQPSQPLEEEESKEENTNRIVKKLIQVKKSSVQANSKQTEIKNYNAALSEVRKQISSEAGKVFKAEQDALKHNKKLYTDPYYAYRNKNQCNQADPKTEVSKVSVP